jgi:hypothetical protein
VGSFCINERENEGDRSGTYAGKLNGAMLTTFLEHTTEVFNATANLAHTPRGNFRTSVSMSLLTIEISV